MKKLLKVMAALTALTLVFACTKTKVIELTVSPLSVNFEAGGGEQTLTVSCNDSWTVTGGADWITFTPASGEGNGSIKITAAANKSLEGREATIAVAAGEQKRTVKVGQLGLTAVLSVSPFMKEMDHNGGSFNLEVTSNIPWTLSIPAAATWITADKTSFEGSGVAKITVAANESTEERSAMLKVVGDPVITAEMEIIQAGEPLYMNVKTEKVEATYEGGSFPVEIEANQAWTVTVPEDATWLKAEPASGEGNATVTVTVENNIYRKGRAATLVITAGETSVDLPVAQDLAPASRQTDSLALVAIYNAFGGAANMKEDRAWDITKAMDDAEAKWYGVTLKEGRVSALKFLKGTVTADWTLPAEVGDLDALTDLRFIDCKLVGDIPMEVFTLTNLEALYFTNNKLTGTVPVEIGQLQNLTNLYIDQNPDLGGEINSGICSLANLVNINISQTSFSGSIPAGITGMTALTNFMAYQTNLSGELPDIWDQLPALKLIQLYGKNDTDATMAISGPLPASIGNCKKLTSIWIYNCNLTGNIPESWANLPATVNQIRIMGNKLQGVIPAAVQAHANWSKWNAAKYILPQQEGYGLTTE